MASTRRSTPTRMPRAVASPRPSQRSSDCSPTPTTDSRPPTAASAPLCFETLTITFAFFHVVLAAPITLLHSRPDHNAFGSFTIELSFVGHDRSSYTVG